MDGIVDSSKRSFQVRGSNQRTMRCSVLAFVMVLLLLVPLAAAQTAARDGPNCLEINTEQLQNSISVDGGKCIKVNLGLLESGDVYEVSISIINDAIDVLFFDQNQVLTYDAGQSYRSQFNQIISTENALGGYDFHWKVPASINPKTYYMILDNLAHDGDNGQGDQGGSTSQIGATLEQIDESYWTPFHDVIAVESQNYATLLSGDDLKLDAGTTIVVTAWSLEGTADIYLQTRPMHDKYVAGEIGQLFVSDLDLQSVSDSDSDTWTVTEELDGEELLIIVDNTDSPIGGSTGDSDIRVTIRVELSPVLTPVINSSSDAVTSINEPLTLDANDSPNKLGQISVLSWDFDDSIDENGDGIFTNDNDAQGYVVTSKWLTTGSKTITLTATSPNQNTATSSYSILVNDIVAPIPEISSSAGYFSGVWKTSINQDTAFSCSSSTDDDAIAGCLWEWGSIFSDSNNSVSIAWPNIGTYLVNLTVTDNSGNTATSTATVVVDDSSIPNLSPQAIENLPTSVVEDGTLTLSIDATDAYDKSYQLTYHWDLNPDVDSDNNGDSTDDPDYVGSSVNVKFSESGNKNIVVTVFDQSGNSDSHAFSVNIDATTGPGNLLGIVFLALFLGLVTISVAMIGFRRWQTNIAVQLLQGRGLSEPEALQHIAMVKKRRKIPLFADAPVLAGLESGQEIVTSEDRAKQSLDAEYESIYGSSDSEQSSSAFAPPSTIQPSPSFAPQFSQYASATNSAAADALAMFAEEENQEIIETNTDDRVVERVTKVVSGGVELPHRVKSDIAPKEIQPVDLSDKELVEDELPSKKIIQRVSCPNCSTSFNIAIPDADEAVVACPSCTQDFIVRFT